MTPAKAKELAELWCKAHGLTYFDTEIMSDVADEAHVISLAALIERVSLETKVWAFELIEGKSLTDSVMIYAQEFSKAKDRLATLNARGGDDK